MDRRTFLGTVAGGLLATSGIVAAQQPTKVWRIGFLTSSAHKSLMDFGYDAAFLDGMREAGYVEGRNLAIEWRCAEGQYERLPALAAELVGLKVDLIMAAPSPAIRAAQQATSTIPIVFPTTGDPVGSGFAASLAHPGGNLTGLSNSSVDVSGKALELLMTIAPKTSRVAFLSNPGGSNAPGILKNLQAAAQKLGIQVFPVDVRTAEELESGFAIMKRKQANALVIAADSLLGMHRRQIAQFVIKYRLPSIGLGLIYAKSGGGLMSYGQDVAESYRRAATYVDKILKGAKPADLPIEQPTKFVLVLNLKTAKERGLTIPQSLLLRADQLIQ